MIYRKGDSIVLTREIATQKPGSTGKIILVKGGWAGRYRYSVLLDETGEVLEGLVQEDLFCPERHQRK